MKNTLQNKINRDNTIENEIYDMFLNFSDYENK
jgi:hypothetical protein